MSRSLSISVYGFSSSSITAGFPPSANIIKESITSIQYSKIHSTDSSTLFSYFCPVQRLRVKNIRGKAYFYILLTIMLDIESRSFFSSGFLRPHQQHRHCEHAEHNWHIVFDCGFGVLRFIGIVIVEFGAIGGHRVQPIPDIVFHGVIKNDASGPGIGPGSETVIQLCISWHLLYSQLIIINIYALTTKATITKSINLMVDLQFDFFFRP